MDIIDGELQRTDQYRDQLTKRKKGADGMADPAKLQQDYERNLKKYQAVVAKQDQVCLEWGLIWGNLCCWFLWRGSKKEEDIHVVVIYILLFSWFWLYFGYYVVFICYLFNIT